jgi:phasin family protein
VLAHFPLKDVAMNSFHVAGFPFATTGLLPALNIEALLELQRKNAAALTSANKAVFDGLKTLAQRQADLFKTTLDDCSKATSDVLGGTSFEERATKQADTARHMYVSTVGHLRELSDIAVKANVAAADILNARATEAFDELKALFATPAAPTGTARAAPTPAIGGPIAVAERATPAGDAVAQIEHEPAPAPTAAARKEAPADKLSRRPAPRR